MTSNLRQNLPVNTKSAETLSLAEQWIANCVANHPQCNTITGRERWYPTRLLDCGPLENPDSRCCLVETRTTALDEPYMTLSHCWGLTDCLKLTSNNYAQLLDGVSFSLLPQLYQDAVFITRSLGIRYLWIDSLCIIQQGDDLTDWRRELALMSDVYLNSFCNISAADAPDGQHTLFTTRNPDALAPEIVQLSVNGHSAPYLISYRQFWGLRSRTLSPILAFGSSKSGSSLRASYISATARCYGSARRWTLPKSTLMVSPLIFRHLSRV